METATKKPGNPNLKKLGTLEEDSKRYISFILTQTHEKSKPKDSKTGEIAQSLYPPIFFIPNAGTAIHPKRGGRERWRYLASYPSIWVNDQETTENKPTRQDIDSEKNHIVFNQGYLRVRGDEYAKIEALKIQDIFEGCENPINDVPKSYTLVDPVKEINGIRKSADEAYEAETAARSATLEEMLPLAMMYGIDVSNADEREGQIRTQFILRAKTNPSSFNKEFVNPKTKIKYDVAKAIKENYLSASEVPGQLIYVDTKVIIMPINSDGDVPDQVASLALSGDVTAAQLTDRLARR